MKRLFALVGLALVTFVLPARAQSPDDQYIRIYNLIQEADALNVDQPASALPKFLEAQSALQKFQKQFPDWHAKVVNYRLTYLAAKIAASPTQASTAPPPATTNAPSQPAARPVVTTPVPDKPPVPSELERQLATLQDEMRVLQSGKTVLEAKLKEALATQPAAVDPRELAKAQEKIQSLMKENDLLKASLVPDPSKSASGASSKALEETKKALAEANRELAEQTQRANSLAAEKQTLQANSTKSNEDYAANLDAAKKALTEANRKLAEQTESSARLVLEKEALETRGRALAARAESADALRAENELLKRQAADLKAAAPSSAARDDTARQLAQAQTQIASLQSDAEILRLEKTGLQERVKQIERANALAAEQQALQERRTRAKLDDEYAANLDATKKALTEASRKLAEQTEAAGKLAREKEALQSQERALTARAESADALRAENELLKRQAADLKAAAPSSAAKDDTARQLAQAQTQIASLKSDAEILRLEKTALQNRVTPPGVAPAPGTAVRAANLPEEAERIKQLERERDDLQKRLAATTKELYGRKDKDPGPRLAELSGEINTLRARLGAFEARAVPYTAEELALFKPPPTQLAATEPAAGKKTVTQFPADARSLLVEAQRYFSAKEFDKAEAKYLEILRRDEQNAYTLANLAAIQLELNHLEDADKNIKHALAVAPDDGYSLSILGYLRFRQDKYEEAFDALSRAAQLNPESAEIQNYLGVTLSHKGMRGPAESALRKAIQLDPGYGSAHNNLAVIYATQPQPAIELARWHYQKALAASHPRNAELEKILDQKSARGSTP